MNTYTLVPTKVGPDKWMRLIYLDYEGPLQSLVAGPMSTRDAHKWLFEHAEPDDWYTEAGNENYTGNSIGALNILMKALEDVTLERITPEENNRIKESLLNK